MRCCAVLYDDVMKKYFFFVYAATVTLFGKTTTTNHTLIFTVDFCIVGFFGLNDDDDVVGLVAVSETNGNQQKL